MGPGGEVALGHWTVTFKADSFSYSFSDMTTSGTYRCLDGVLTGKAAGRMYAGRYDPQRNILVWSGNEYQKLE